MNNNSSLNAFSDILSYFWIARENDEMPFGKWQKHCLEAPKQAERALKIIEAVLSAPPANLDKIIQMNAQLTLPANESTNQKEILSLYIKWLRRTYDRLKSEFDDHLNSPLYSLTQYMKNCWIKRDEYGAFQEFQELMKKDPENTSKMLTHLVSLSQKPPENLSDTLRVWGLINLYDDNGKEYSNQEYIEWFQGIVSNLVSWLNSEDF